MTMAAKWKVYWGVVALSLALYFTMIFWSLPLISSMAGGLVPFDMRPGGYTHVQAQVFLTALSAEGAQFYLNVQQLLDAAYPAALAIVLTFGALGMAAGRSKWLGRIAAIAAVGGAAFDYLENAAVKVLLLAGPDGISAEAVSRASRWTLYKSVLTTVSMTIILILLIWALVQWVKRRQT
jgi:hypothetical protein